MIIKTQEKSISQKIKGKKPNFTLYSIYNSFFIKKFVIITTTKNVGKDQVNKIKADDDGYFSISQCV